MPLALLPLLFLSIGNRRLLPIGSASLPVPPSRRMRPFTIAKDASLHREWKRNSDMQQNLRPSGA